MVKIRQIVQNKALGSTSGPARAAQGDLWGPS